MKKDNKSEGAILRQRAEELVKRNLSKSGSQLSEVEMIKIIHELEVYQIELEMQNEELSEAKVQADVATEKYSELYDFAPSGYFTLSKAGKIIELNLSGANMLGKERSRLKNSLFSSFVSDATKPVFNLFLVKVFSSKVRETCEVSLSINVNVPMYVYLSGIFTENVEHCFVTVLDITERKHAEDALRKSEAKQGKMVANIGDVIVIIDQNGINRYKSLNIEKWFGWKPEDLVGENTWENIHPDDLDSVMKLFDTILGEPNTTAKTECRFRCKDGNYKWIELTGVNLLHDPDIRGILGNYHDITERKRAEAEQARLLYIMESSLNEIYVFDSVTLIFDYVNQGALRNLGYTREAMRSMTPFDMKPEFTEESFRQIIMPLLRHEQEQLLFNTVHRRADGSLYPVEIHLQLVELEGQRVFLAMILDITERKLAEEALIESERLLRESQTVAHLGSYVWNLSTWLWKSSRILDEIFGIDENYIRSLDGWTNIIHPDWREILKDYVINEVTGKYQRFDKEYLIIRQNDGQKRWVHGQGELEFDNSNQPIKLIGTISDITKRKQAEEVLRESEASLNLALQSASMSVWQFDIIEDRRYFDDQVCYLLGINPATFTGTAEEFFRAVHPDDRQTIKMALARTIEKDVLYEPEYRVVWPDKSIHYIATRGRLSRDDKGKPARINGIIWDITEYKQKEEVLLKLKKAVDNSGEIIFLTDKEGVFTFINRAFTSIYGFTADEIVGKVSPRILKSGLMEENNYKLFWETLLSGKEVRGELINKRKDGTSITVECTSSPIFDEKKNIIGFLGIQRDITERKQAEEALQESEIKFRSITEQTTDLIAITDINGFILYASPASKTLFHYTQEEMCGHHFSEFIDETTVPEAIAGFNTMLGSGERTKVERRMKRKDNSIFIGELNRSKYQCGELNGVLVIIHDITERKQVEIELIKAKNKAEESDRLKSAFLANMSHEVRTPLNSIIGFSELLADPFFEDEQKNEFIQSIITSGNNLLSIISDIMDISKMESGEIKIRKSPINVQKFIADIYEQFSSQTEAKKLELKLTLPDNDEETAVFADSDRLSQVFNNLINNAIKFTENGSIEIGYHSMGTMVKFYVKDTGIGIPAEFHRIIFERFRQVEISTTREFGGNGLGLAISKNLVELMGGRIWLESEAGKGSVFYFTLPANNSES